MNEKLANQRANNAKEKIIAQYWLDKTTTNFEIKTELQSDFPDKINEDVMLWQWVKVMVIPTEWNERAYRDALVETSIKEK